MWCQMTSLGVTKWRHMTSGSARVRCSNTLVFFWIYKHRTMFWEILEREYNFTFLLNVLYIEKWAYVPTSEMDHHTSLLILVLNNGWETMMAIFLAQWPLFWKEHASYCNLVPNIESLINALVHLIESK